jgi:hypothetical protein
MTWMSYAMCSDMMEYDMTWIEYHMLSTALV